LQTQQRRVPPLQRNHILLKKKKNLYQITDRMMEEATSLTWIVSENPSTYITNENKSMGLSNATRSKAQERFTLAY